MPVEVSLPAGVIPTAIAAGQGIGYAIGSDGHLYAWGDNEFGALGVLAAGTSSPTPVVVSLPSGVEPTAVAAGFETGYTIGSDGRLYGWGDNYYGELGTGTSLTDSAVTVVVPRPAGVMPLAIAGGAGTGYALGSNGTLYAWGLNASGQLGNGGTANSSTPMMVALPPGSTAKRLGAEPGSPSAYAVVSAPDTAPVVTAQPVDQSVTSGQAVSFTAAATGLPTPTVQWQVSTDGGTTYAAVPGATSDTLTVADATTAENGNEYRAVLTNDSGGATTDAAVLTVAVTTAPQVTTQPAEQVVYSGQSETFSAAASGFPTPTAERQVSVDGGTTWFDIPN